MNQKYLKILTLSAMLISNVGLNVPAYSNTITEKMNVSADINASCIMSNTDLNFGEYNAIGINASEDLLANATITTTCTAGTTGVVTMSGGSYSSHCISSKCYRRMANIEESNFLWYNIYTKENGNWKYVWSDNPSSTREVGHVVGSGASEDLPVYAKVFKKQKTVAAGSYTDEVNITLTY